MKSRISIDMDWDNQPIIKIDYQASDDVRDKMVKRFMESFGGESCWANFYFDNLYHDTPNVKCTLRPIAPEKLKEQLPMVEDSIKRFGEIQNPKTV